MKKLLSLVLVLCMILTSCLVFTSCVSKVSEKDVEKDPQAVLNEAIQNSSSQFFTDDAGASETLKKALESGALTVSFECDTLLGDLNIEKISETIYMNKDADRFVSDTLVKYNGENLSARIFLDKNGLILNSESVLGSTKSYAINLSTFAEKFATSDLAKTFEIDEETLAQVTEVFNQIKTEYEKLFAENNDEAEKLANDMLALMNQTIASEKVESAEGKKVDCVVVTYSINNDTLKAVLEKAMNELPLDETSKAEAKASVDEMIAELNETATLNLSAVLYINKKSSDIEKIEVKGDITPKEIGSEKMTVDAVMTFSETEISVVVKVTEGDKEIAGVDVKLTKEEKDGVYTYSLVVNATMNEENVTATVNVINAKYIYNKSTGAFEITLDIIEDEEDRMTVGAKGTLTVDKKSVKLEVTSVTYGEITVNCKLIVAFEADVEMPAAPTDAKDIVTMTEEEIYTFMEEFQNSKVAQLIFGAMY